MAAAACGEAAESAPRWIVYFLAGGLELFFAIVNGKSSQLTIRHIFQRGRLKPPTSFLMFMLGSSGLTVGYRATLFSQKPYVF